MFYVHLTYCGITHIRFVRHAEALDTVVQQFIESFGRTPTVEEQKAA